MFRIASRLCLAAWAWTSLSGQTPPARPAFEVASLKPSAPATDGPPMMAEMRAQAMEGMYDAHPPGWLPIEKTRLTMRNRALRNLIASAWRVRPVQVSGPAWLADARFDIEAVIPEATPREAVPDMLQTLLEERFGLQVHRDDKEVAGFALLVGKDGAKLTLAAAAAESDAPPLDADARKARMEKM